MPEAALAKARPGQVAYSSAGSGTGTHLSAELFKNLTGADLLHVPYKGGGPSVNALLAGEAQVSFATLPSVLPQVRAGKLKVLAQLADSRIPAFKDVPTVKESGYELPKIPQIRGVVGPPNMPTDALAYYEGLFKRLAASAGWKQYIESNYFEDGYLSAAASKKFLEEYEADIRVQLQATGAKVVR